MDSRQQLWYLMMPLHSFEGCNPWPAIHLHTLASVVKRSLVPRFPRPSSVMKSATNSLFWRRNLRVGAGRVWCTSTKLQLKTSSWFVRGKLIIRIRNTWFSRRQILFLTSQINYLHCASSRIYMYMYTDISSAKCTVNNVQYERDYYIVQMY